MKSLLILLVIVTWAPYPLAGFIPARFLAWTVQGLDLSLDSTITHKEMSRAAILNVAADLLRDNPNPDSPGSSSRIADLSSLSEESLVTAYYGEMQRSITVSFQSAIRAISNANADVDLGGEKRKAAAHFDSEQIQAGHNRLVEIHQNIVVHILKERFDLARMETGRLFHTLQDFYSHSNWIESGNCHPYHVLGRANERPGNIADQNAPSCTNCEEGRTVFNIAFFNSVFRLFRPHSCQDNIVNDLLTTGYSSGQYDNNGREIEKPAGKCSHGGFLDETSDLPANGGINKDSPYEVWSPHYYLYEEAAKVAQQATSDTLQEIRDNVDNDTLFSMYLGLDVVQDISIAYVIDTTSSMAEELPEIQATIPTIRTELQQYVETFGGSMRVRYILVPFSDPGMWTLLVVRH